MWHCYAFRQAARRWQLPRFLLRVDGGLVHQHDGDVVAHRINASALITLKSVILFRQRGFADRTDQNLEKTFVDHFGNFTPNVNDLAAEISLHSACISICAENIRRTAESSGHTIEFWVPAVRSEDG